MSHLQIDQVNIVLPDVAGAAEFLRVLGAEVQELDEEWAAWAPHHVGLRPATEGFAADLDSPAFASHWGGLPRDAAGIVVNLRTEDRDAVDTSFERALTLGGDGLRAPYDAFWGARYAVVQGPGPIVVGIMSPVDPDARGEPPTLSDFA